MNPTLGNFFYKRICLYYAGFILKRSVSQKVWRLVSLEWRGGEMQVYSHLQITCNIVSSSWKGVSMFVLPYSVAVNPIWGGTEVQVYFVLSNVSQLVNPGANIFVLLKLLVVGPHWAGAEVQVSSYQGLKLIKKWKAVGFWSNWIKRNAILKMKSEKNYSLFAVYKNFSTFRHQH